MAAYVSLMDLAIEVVEEFRRFSFKEALVRSRCSYDADRDKLSLNFTRLTRPVNRLKLCHELAHRAQSHHGMLRGRELRDIELEAIEVSKLAYLTLGYSIDKHTQRYLDYNLSMWR